MKEEGSHLHSGNSVRMSLIHLRETIKECLMDWDDEYDNGYNDMDNALQREESMPDKSAEGGFDPMDIANPVSAYFLLSDDAQDEISGGKKKNMKCFSCGQRFAGESYDSCPGCYSVNTDEKSLQASMAKMRSLKRRT